MSLTEVLIASTLLIVVLTCVMITMDLLDRVSSSVSAQSAEYDQAIPALGPLQNLLRAEVEPGPYLSGVPQPGFVSVGNFSLTFYANIGTAYNNVTFAGTAGGPAKIVAQEVDPNGNPVTSSSNCTTAKPCSFQVKQYLPIITAGVSSCPVVGNPGSTCRYSSTFKLLTNVLSVVNNPNPNPPFGPIQPIFSYNIFDTTTQAGQNLTATAVQTGLTCVAPGPGTLATSCPADVIQSVGIELMVAKPGAGTNGTVDDQTIVYRYAQSPGSTTYPYQYTSSAG
jgi:hypothetical protein